jgi:hypothetical protein
MRFPEHVARIRKMVVEKLYGKRRKFWRIILKWKIRGWRYRLNFVQKSDQ